MAIDCGRLTLNVEVEETLLLKYLVEIQVDPERRRGTIIPLREAQIERDSDRVRFRLNKAHLPNKFERLTCPTANPLPCMNPQA